MEDLPEERVRQSLIHQMVHELGFPLECLAVEKAIHHMPHFAGVDSSKLPLRRVDLVCFATGIHPKHHFYPLLLVECKAVQFTQEGVRQAIGYYHHIRPYFIALASPDRVQTGWFASSEGEFQFVPYLPPFSELCRAISR